MGVKEEGKTAGVIIASYPAINYEENETGRKHEKEKQLKERGLRGVAGIQIMPSSGRGECYSHSERGEAKSMTRQYFMMPFKKQQAKRSSEIKHLKEKGSGLM